ncbi:hypothetical protein LCGC14_2363040, partial [marine sediment metagenome]
DGPSRLYLCNPFTVAWPPTPQRFFGAITRFFPKNIGLTSGLNSSAHCTPPESNSYHGSSISGLQAFLYVQASVIARPPGCSHPVIQQITEQLSRLHHAAIMRLPNMNCGIATHPNRAIGATGLSPAGLQPCRLLLSRSSISS